MHTQNNINHVEISCFFVNIVVLLLEVGQNMRVVNTTHLVHITWLMIAILYRTNSHRVHSHNSLEWHEQSCLISIVSHNQVISKQLEWYYANIPNDIVKSWNLHAQCCFISIHSHKILIFKQLEWYFANTHNIFDKSCKYNAHCCL